MTKPFRIFILVLVSFFILGAWAMVGGLFYLSGVELPRSIFTLGGAITAMGVWGPLDKRLRGSKKAP